VRDLLRGYGIHGAVGADRFFPTVGVTVGAYLGETGVDRLDWEERQADGSAEAEPSGRDPNPRPA
jgi:hypothetical protein